MNNLIINRTCLVSYILKVAGLLGLLATQASNAGELCPKVVSKGEGHWPVPEEAFTKEHALKASIELNELLNKVEGPLISSKDLGGLDISPYVMNRIVFIKGFALKSEAIESSKHDRDYSKWAIKEFCDFIKTEAFTWH